MNSPSPTTDEEQCMVCLSSQRADDRLWTCATCGKTCHLLCIFQWTLRLSLNHSRNFANFSCPGCRAEHALSTLPGFEQHPTAAPARERRRSTRRDAAALVDPEETTLQEVAREADDDDDNNDNDDDDDDDDDTYSISSTTGGRWNFRVDTERIYVDVDTFTINIHSR